MKSKLKYAFRITHIDNIAQISKVGILRRNSNSPDSEYVSIGDQRVIQLRSEIEVEGQVISDYIPFYFGPRSPMLYVIQHGYNNVEQVDPEKIVYCVIRLDDLVNHNIDCIFTNGHALSISSSFFSKEKLPFIDSIINKDDVYSTKWNPEADNDLKRRKEAELLIKNDLPASFIRGYIVYNEKAKQSLVELGIDDSKIVIKKNYYF